MVRQIKTEKFEGLAVLVPYDYLWARLEDWAEPSIYFNPKSIHVIKHSKKLPFGKWEIVGKATELTEEQCADIVIDGHLEGSYKNYVKHQDFSLHFYEFKTAYDSFASLMQSIGSYSINPFAKPDINSEKYVPISDDAKDTLFMHDWDQWENAQEHTGTWLILQKV